MIYLADTNVIMRLLRGQVDPQYRVVRTAIAKLQTMGEELRATPQNFIECWNVLTRPTSQNGYGLTPQGAAPLLGVAETTFLPLPVSQQTYIQWRRLVVQYGVSGIQVHDAHLVAAMLAHNITHILTFNTSDFARYAPEGIVAVDPASV